MSGAYRNVSAPQAADSSREMYDACRADGIVIAYLKLALVSPGASPKKKALFPRWEQINQVSSGADFAVANRRSFYTVRA